MKIIKSNRSITMEKTDEFLKKIRPEEDVTIETINAFGDRFENLSELEDLMSMNNPPHHHPLTGPIYVEGAMPGDFLKVQIESIELFDMAQMLSKSAGIAPLEKDENFDFSSRYPIYAQVENKTKKIRYIKSQMNLEVAPCVGMIATMPKEGIIKTGHIGVTGGNFDNPFITEGVSIYLPVQVEGAGLYLGDVHAKQAYGELSGIALEASANVKIKVSILKPWIPFESNPIFIMGKEPLTKQNALAVIGIGKNFKNGDEAVRDSFFKTVEVIKRLKPTLSKMMIRSMLSLIGNSMAGQAYSNTSESTSQILLTEDEIRSIYFTENENILDDLELCLFRSDKDAKDKPKTLITIGAVKGRLQKVLHKYIESLGIEIPEINPRLLVYDIETPKYILRINLLKWKDISKNYNKFDLVIYGADKWLENSNKAFVALKHFEQNDCRMSILVPNELKDYPISYFLKRNIATTYPNILKQNYDIKDSNIVDRPTQHNILLSDHLPDRPLLLQHTDLPYKQKPQNPPITQINSAILDYKTPAIQTNPNCLYGWQSVFYVNFRGLILVLVEEEVLFRGVVGPYVFDTFVYFAFVFYFLEIFDDFEGRTAAHSVVDELVFSGGPGRVFELRG